MMEQREEKRQRLHVEMGAMGGEKIFETTLDHRESGQEKCLRKVETSPINQWHQPK